MKRVCMLHRHFLNLYMYLTNIIALKEVSTIILQDLQLNVRQRECILIIFQLRKCVKIMKVMYFHVWDAEVFSHRGKMKTENISLRDDLIRELSA